jgi:serine protease Do
MRVVQRASARIARARIAGAHRNHRSRGYARRVGALALVIVIGWATGAPAFARGAPDSFADLAAKLVPAVVNVSTTQTLKREALPQMPQLPPGSPFEEFFKEFFDRQHRDAPARRATSLGSGFIIDPSGLIVTNNHVIADADEISVVLHDETRLKAEVVGRDTKTDLAILRVKSKTPLPAVAFGDSSKARVGDWVLAIGNPFGLGGSVTAGIISARARNINAGPYDDFIQTDAAINRGNSGGPLFNVDGKVIGINTAIYSPSGGSVGIGFSIPSNLARPVIEQLVKYGKARRGWIGVRIQTVTPELAESLGLDKPHGALVSAVTDGGPAQKAKIEVGDVILTFNGKPIDEMRELPRIVAETAIGKRVPVVIWRKGTKLTLSANLAEYPEEKQIAAAPENDKVETPPEKPATALGLTMAQITPDLRQKFKLDDAAEGVVITDVAADSAAAEKGVRTGDVIRKVGSDQAAVAKPAEVLAKVDEARKAKAKTILFLFERDGNPRFVAIRL